MAEVVDVLPPKQSGRGRGSLGTNHWDRFLDGRVWRLTPGEDFHGTPRQVGASIRQRAHRLGLRGIAVRFEDGFVFVQAAGEETR